MPDITMCCNYDCPLKDKCYRYRAVPDSYWQSFAMFNTTGEKDCDHFWQLDILTDKVLPTAVVDNRYERDGKWKGLLEEKDVK